jgi:surface carbohydrate biosynthesis protein (TIGR04326 family)
MSKAILFFDEHININELKNINKLDKVDIFSLTSNWSIMETVKKVIASFSLEGRLLNSSGLINEEFEKIRENVAEWSANLGEYSIWNKSIKEWFLTPENEVSTWWFSLLSEKNNLKTDIFFRLAQINAMESLLKRGGYNFCYFSISEAKLRKVVKRVCAKHSLENHFISSKYTDAYNIRAVLMKCKERMVILGDVLHSLLWFSGCILKGLKAKSIMSGKGKRKKESNKPLLFVSYFPAVDMAVAERGVFVNKYAVALQEKLREMNKPIIWLFMYVPIYGYSYNDALKLGRNFASNGEIVYFMQEFISIRLVLYCLFSWIVQLIKYLVITNQITPKVLTENLTILESEMFLYPLWRQSFVGAAGMQGIVYFELYKKIFGFFKETSHCIYYAEMHAWEKALNAAKMVENQRIQTIGFLHSSFSKFFFPYFYDKRETSNIGKVTDLPLPDIVAYNGKLMLDLLAKSGYQNLTMVEAIRYVYLDEVFSTLPQPRSSNPLLLVAGSVDKIESTNLITLVNAAFPKAETFDICFKGHPSLPFEKLFEEVGIDISERGYMISHNNISECLDSAWAVLVPSSTVSIEALAFGCEVIVPVFSNSMLMNPLADFKEFYHKVTSPEELKDTMCKIANGFTLHSIDEYREFVKKCWCIDRTLPRWTNLLKSNE